MKSVIKALLVLGLAGVFITGLARVKSDTHDQNPRWWCCNHMWPRYDLGPDYHMTLACGGEEYHPGIQSDTCARYWSAYGKPEHAIELCLALPDPPLPPIPFPSNFDVSNNDNQPEITWNQYYVHWYDIHRKTDSGSWSRVQRITAYTTDSWTDQSTDISNHCYCYKMRGSVYDSYSNYTSVKSIGAFTGSMSGPGSLDPYEVGTFTAHPSLCGISPFDYTWYRMEGGGPEPLRGGVQPLRPPVGQWVHLSWFDGSQTATSSGVFPGFKMRVVVEDHEGSVVTVEKTVSVGGGLKKSLAKEEPQQKVPDRFALFPNYPNPFNPTTEITYSLAEESRVVLSVYNVLGEKIRTLINNLQAAGRYSVLWDGRDENGKSLSGGVYIYRLEAVPISEKKPFTAIGKMVLVK